MAYARVVTFDGVDSDRMAKLAQQVNEDERPDDIPATEIVILHDADAEKALAILFFDSEDDYRRGDATLNAMDSGETPGQRSSVTKYDVAVKRSG
ncbi:MAG: hypothetical protein E6G42_04660 [Actinobacteria bacterium]|nr:MAG: hypothetical protein E6G42_04660 [Actinomycetota bacterium]